MKGNGPTYLHIHTRFHVIVTVVVEVKFYMFNLENNFIFYC